MDTKPKTQWGRVVALSAVTGVVAAIASTLIYQLITGEVSPAVTGGVTGAVVGGVIPTLTRKARSEETP